MTSGVLSSGSGWRVVADAGSSAAEGLTCRNFLAIIRPMKKLLPLLLVAMVLISAPAFAKSHHHHHNHHHSSHHHSQHHSS